MKYIFNHQNYCNFNIFEENKLKGRTYFIPFKTKSSLELTDVLTERYNSDMVTMLSGEWDFCYYSKISGMPKAFDTAEQAFDKINVPSCWQFTGYAKPVYINQRYEFKPNPPHIPKDIAASVYRKHFVLDKVAPSEILTFLGVCSCLELYINGNYVGYSEGSHNSAEFQVAKYLQDGDNEIVALVYKFCNGSYIEAQDMFRNNGIFRDVYMTHAGERAIFDFTVTSEKRAGGEYDLHLITEVLSLAGTIKYTLYHGKQQIATTMASSSSEILLSVGNVKEWTAETPNLYALYIELLDENGKTIELVRDYIGFRTVEIKGDVFYFNDKNVKLLGVNHHDSTPHAGFVMTAKEIEKDILLMKELNVNCVRTSHYPPDPMLVKLCNKYGIYVCLEADIEAHGVAVPEHYRPNSISHNLAWKEHYWDRVKRAYERDKTNPSIFMWSLGNEAGGYACQDYCYENLKKLTTEPIHYEGAIRTKRWAYDVISNMYRDTDGCYKVAEGKEKKYTGKPFFQCEYAHAMGVGPGDLDYYVDSFLAGDNMMGGCIWEWCDHAVLHDNDGYSYKYTYGGDHEEPKHDSNFCVDGLVYPDRTPHTGALCMKNCYRPLRVTHVGDKKFEIKNIRRFTDSSDIKIFWSLLEYGKEITKGEIKDVVLPMMSEVVTLDYPTLSGGDNFVIFSYFDKKTNAKIAYEQVTLSENLGNVISPSRDVENFETQEFVGFNSNKGAVKFDKTNGALASYVYDDIEYINQEPQREDKMKGFVATIYRAAIDNYMYRDKKWKKQNINKTKHVFLGFESEKNRGVIKAKYQLLCGNTKAFTYTIKYKMYGNGSMDVKLKICCTAIFHEFDLPKVGLSLEMPKEFNNVEFYGMGNYENYSDFSKQSVMGVYKTNVAEMRQPYIKPQDSGNRANVRWAKVTNQNGRGLEFLALEKAFNFSATDITLDSLQKAKHREDAVPMNTTNVSIDSFVRGIGSNSCGPDTRDKYKLVVKKGYELKYKFRIIPM